MARFSRRKFVTGAGMALLAGAAPFGLWQAQALFNGKRHLFTSGQIGTQQYVCRVDWAAGTVLSVPIEFIAHSVYPSPGDPSRGIAVEKWGRRAVEVDFDAQKVVQKFSCDQDALFFGHSVYAPDGNTVYMSVAHYGREKGMLVGYDTKTFKPVAEHLLPGMAHDCQLGPGNTILTACNGMLPIMKNKTKENKIHGPRVEPVSLTQLDMGSGKMIRQWLMEGENLVNGHFAQNARGMFVKSTYKPDAPAPQRANVHIGRLDQPGYTTVTMTPADRRNLRGELFSMAISTDEKTVAVVDPDAISLILVDVEKNAVKKVISIPRIYSVAWHAEAGYFIASGMTGLRAVYPDGTMKDVKIGDVLYHTHSAFV